MFEILPALKNEVKLKKCQFGKDYVKLEFKNGSRLDVVAARNSARGGRRHGRSHQNSSKINKMTKNVIIIIKIIKENKIMNYNMFYYIYSIVNKKNGKRYIGYTNDLDRRLYDHFKDLQLGKHPNKKMQKEFTDNDFEIEILEAFRKISVQEIARREKYWIKKYDSYNNGYNQTTGGEISTKKVKKDEKFDMIFILRYYPNSSPIVQKIFEASESAVLRLKNRQTYLNIQNEVDTLSEEKIEEIKQKMEEKYQISEKLENHKRNVTQKARQLDKETIFQIIAARNNLKGVGGIIERKLGLAAQHTSRIKNGERYKDYYAEYQTLSDDEKEYWLRQAIINFELPY